MILYQTQAPYCNLFSIITGSCKSATNSEAMQKNRYIAINIYLEQHPSWYAPQNPVAEDLSICRNPVDSYLKTLSTKTSEDNYYRQNLKWLQR